MLFRTGSWNDPFEADHPMVGKQYGDFYLPRQWVSPNTKVLNITQHRGLVVSIVVREFMPPDEYVTDDKGLWNGIGRSVYAIPWAVEDPEVELQKLHKLVDNSVGQYLESFLDDTDPLIWNVYREALRLSQLSHPVRKRYHTRLTVYADSVNRMFSFATSSVFGLAHAF